MNSKNDKPAPSPFSKKAYQPGIYASAILFLTLVFLWFDLSKTKDAQMEQAVQSAKLAEALKATQSELASARKELDFFKTGAPASAPQKNAVKSAPVAAKPVDVPETLFLQEPTVNQTDTGLAARFGFTPGENVELPELVTLVVRVPSDANSKILSLKPVQDSSYSDVNFLINAAGSLGMIEGSPADLKALEFELTVSAPVNVLVRGSKGIKDFEMDISPSGCVIRKLP